MLYAISRCEELFEGVYIQNGDIIAKTCTLCGKLLYIDDFLDGKSKNRYGYKTCDRCRGEYAKRSAKWRANNTEKMKESRAKWVAKNCERERERHAKRYAENRGYFKKYYADNSTRRKELISSPIHQDKSKRLVDTAMKYLTASEKPEVDEDGFLTVQCKLCGTRFRPTYGVVQHRIATLKGQVPEGSLQENNFYCSQECKDSCVLYRSRGADPAVKHKSILDDARSEEWAEEVKRRAGYVCQECGATEGLQAHHIMPLAYESSVFSADYDNGVCLCHACHMKAHSSDGCGFGELAHVKKCA